MKLWKRPSLYLAVVPPLILAVGAAAHGLMACGYECTGAVSGPIDRVILFLLYLFGYALSYWWGLAGLSLLVEEVARRVLRVSRSSTIPPSPDPQKLQ